MTIGITVTCNGNYKVPVKVIREDGTETTETISGKGLDRPAEYKVSHYHGQITTVVVGLEEPDSD